MRAGKTCSGLANTARCAPPSIIRNGTGGRPPGEPQNVQLSSLRVMRRFSNEALPFDDVRLAPTIISPRGPSQRSSTISPSLQRRQSPAIQDRSAAGAACATLVTNRRASIRMGFSMKDAASIGSARGRRL